MASYAVEAWSLLTGDINPLRVFEKRSALRKERDVCRICSNTRLDRGGGQCFL